MKCRDVRWCGPLDTALSAIHLWMKELLCSSCLTWKMCHQGERRRVLVDLSRELDMYMTHHPKKKRELREGLREGLKVKGEGVPGWEVPWGLTGSLDAK